MTQPTLIPLVLFVYRRPAHTARVLESLRSALPAATGGAQAGGPGLLYVYSDGPADQAVAPAVQAVRELIARVDFVETRLIARDRNLGLARSLVTGVTETLSRHPAAVFLEDDCLPLEGFWPFMRQALDQYRDHPTVLSVGAHLAPTIAVPPDYPFRAVLSPRFASWGWGTWADRWARYSNDLGEIENRCRAEGIDLNQAGSDITGYLADPRVRDGQADIWTLGWTLTHYLHRAHTILPLASLVENIGFDATAVHTRRPDPAWNLRRGRLAYAQFAERPWPPAEAPPPAFVTRGLRRQFDLRPGLRARLRAWAGDLGAWARRRWPSLGARRS